MRGVWVRLGGRLGAFCLVEEEEEEEGRVARCFGNVEGGMEGGGVGWEEGGRWVVEMNDKQKEAKRCSKCPWGSGSIAG